MIMKFQSKVGARVRENKQRENKRADGGFTIVVEEQPDESPTRAILRGVAALKGAKETDLDPLYDSIDVDAMEEMMEHSRNRDTKARLKFSFEGCTIHVGDEGDITITENADNLG